MHPYWQEHFLIQNLNVSTRQIIMRISPLSIRKNREADIKDAIKARLEVNPDIDDNSPMKAHLIDVESHEKIFSAHLQSAEDAGSPLLLSELRVEDHVKYVLWCNLYIYPNQL